MLHLTRKAQIMGATCTKCAHKHHAHQLCGAYSRLPQQCSLKPKHSQPRDYSKLDTPAPRWTDTRHGLQSHQVLSRQTPRLNKLAGQSRSCEFSQMVSTIAFTVTDDSTLIASLHYRKGHVHIHWLHTGWLPQHQDYALVCRCRQRNLCGQSQRSQEGAASLHSGWDRQLAGSEVINSSWIITSYLTAVSQCDFIHHNPTSSSNNMAEIGYQECNSKQPRSQLLPWLQHINGCQLAQITGVKVYRRSKSLKTPAAQAFRSMDAPHTMTITADRTTPVHQKLECALQQLTRIFKRSIK